MHGIKLTLNWELETHLETPETLNLGIIFLKDSKTQRLVCFIQFVSTNSLIFSEFLKTTPREGDKKPNCCRHVLKSRRKSVRKTTKNQQKTIQKHSNFMIGRKRGGRVWGFRICSQNVCLFDAFSKLGVEDYSWRVFRQHSYWFKWWMCV